MTSSPERRPIGPIRTLVPFTPRNPKSRLGAILSGRERERFARAMLDDVLAAVDGAAGDPLVLTTEQLRAISAEQRIDDRPLTAAVDAALEPPMAVVMADLALATPDSLRRLFTTDGDLVIAPGRGGGTNALVVREEAFAVDYHGNSLGDHRAIAADAGLEVREVDSFRLATDVDEPADLVEVLLHTDGKAATWLREQGIGLSVTDGRVSVTRADE